MLPTAIYIFGNIDFDAGSAAAKRMTYYAQALAEKENQVFLLSCCSNEFAFSDFQEVSKNIFVQKDKKMVFGFWSTLGFLRNLNRFANTNRKEAAFLLYPQSYFFLELLSVFYLIFFKRTSVYFELNEVKRYASNFHEPLSLKRMKYSFKTIIYKRIFWVVDNLMHFYKGLICISTNIEKYGQRYNKNTLKIPILTDSQFSAKTTINSYRQEECFNIGFSGSIIPSKENLFSFIGVVEKARSNGYRISFNLCGSIAEEYKKILFEEESKYPFLKYYGELGQNELSGFLLQQDILVVPRGYTLQNHYGFSTKLSDYLNHKKIILVTDISDNSLYIDDGVNGFMVPPNDPDMMYDKLTYIIDNFELLEKKIVTNAFKTSKQVFDYRIYGDALQGFLFPKPVQSNASKSVNAKAKMTK